MRIGLVSILVLAVTFATAGCGGGPKMLKTKGKIVKEGEDFVPEEGEGLQVCFIPISEDKSPAKHWYAADVDQSTGHFTASGGEYKGMPPGKYRVMVELKKNKKDLFKGKFDVVNSPFVFEVDEGSEMIIVDIGDPPPKTE